MNSQILILRSFSKEHEQIIRLVGWESTQITESISQFKENFNKPKLKLTFMSHKVIFNFHRL